MNDPSAALQRLGAALSSGDRDAVMACFAADATVDVISDDGRIAFTGEGIREAFDALLTGFEDIRVTPTSRQVLAAQVVEESVLSGDHHGIFAAAQPTHSRVRVNVKLTATAGTDSNLQSLWVEADTRALFAQIAGTDDGVGVTGGLIAAARERHDGAVRVIGAAKTRTEAVASRKPPPRTSGLRRLRAALLVATALALIGFVVSRSGSFGPAFDATAAHPSGPQSSTSRPTTSRPTTVAPRSPSPTAVSPQALPVIKVAPPKSVPHVQPGRQVVLKSDVLFGLDSAVLSPAARTALNRVAGQVRSAGLTGTIQVNGYTDNLGSAAHNVALASARALAVAGVLQQGLAGRPITLAPQGFGQASPVAPNTTDAGRARNRRVTIVLPTPR